MDEAISGAGLVAGANRPDAHLIGVEPGRDFEYERCDVRTVEAGDTTDAGGTIEIEPAIEVGNIFKLGTRYSEPLGATYLDESGDRAPDRDGQLRDRPGADRRRRDRAGRRREGNRLAAADRARGTSTWSRSARAATRWPTPPSAAYEALREAGIEAVLDDRRGAGTGEKLTDAELIGCPLRLVVGKRGLAEGVAEAQVRGDGTEESIELERVAEGAASILAGLEKDG